jgi:hypothetical protein
MLDTYVVVFCVGATDTASARILPWFETSFKVGNARASSRGKLKNILRTDLHSPILRAILLLIYGRSVPSRGIFTPCSLTSRSTLSPLECVPMAIFIHISLALCLLFSFVAAHPGHNLHHGADHFHQPRQEGGAPFAGIEILSTPGAPIPNVPTLTTITRTSRLKVSSSGNRPSGPTTYLTAGGSTIGPFSVTVIPVAIATICSSGLHPALIPSNSSLVWSPTRSDSDAGARLPAAATALLRLDSAEANDTSAPVPTFTGYDGLGCSTLYTRTSSAICATVLSGLGAIPVSVTDCGQSITFSTSTGFGPVPTAAIQNDHPLEQGAPIGERVAHFIAPWYDAVEGNVPTSVLVQNCVQGMEGEACGLATESWSVVNQTSSVAVTQSLAFEGPVTGVSCFTGCGVSRTKC